MIQQCIKTNSHSVSVSIDHIFECQHICNKWYNGHIHINLISHIDVAGYCEIDDILDDKQNECNHNAYFGSGYKYLHEETLENEDYIEEDVYCQ